MRQSPSPSVLRSALRRCERSPDPQVSPTRQARSRNGDDVEVPNSDLTSSGLQARWLKYARDVVENEDHRVECSKAGGSDPLALVKERAGTEHPAGFASDVRWPGYLGTEYRPGGVIWVSNIHRNFDSAGLPPEFAEEANDCIRSWREGTDNDETFLLRLRSVYLRGLSTWTVGARARTALDRLGVPLEAIAYTNAARCQAPDTGTGLQELCLSKWSLRDLVSILEPSLVLLTSETALRLSGRTRWPCTVLAFSQRNGRLMKNSPWQPLGATGPTSQGTWLGARRPEASPARARRF